MYWGFVQPQARFRRLDGLGEEVMSAVGNGRGRDATLCLQEESLGECDGRFKFLSWHTETWNCDLETCDASTSGDASSRHLKICRACGRTVYGSLSSSVGRLWPPSKAAGESFVV